MEHIPSPPPPSTQAINKNLLTNWYFSGGGSQNGNVFPINQQMKTAYNDDGNNGTIDMWRLDNEATLTINEEYITLHVPANAEAGKNFFLQFVCAITAFVESEYTMSILTTDGLYYKTFEYNKDSVLDVQLSIADGIYLSVYTNSGDIAFRLFSKNAEATDINVIAAKLEYGNTQTLAYQNGDTWKLTETPNFTEELLKCQRYMIQLNPAKTQDVIIGWCIKISSFFYAYIPVQQTMASTPSLVYSGVSMYCQTANGNLGIVELVPTSYSNGIYICRIIFEDTQPTGTTGTLFAKNIMGSTGPSIVLRSNL